MLLISDYMKLVASLNSKIICQGGNVYGNDFNNYVEIGVYTLTGSLTNAPASTTYWTLYVLETAFTWRMQFATQGNRFYYRAQPTRSDSWSAWTSVFVSASPTVTAGAVSSLPNISCNGSAVTLEFANQLPAGTYSSGLWTVSPAPKHTIHFLVALGSNMTIMRLNTSGRIDFNNSVTLSGAAYLIGSLTYNY